MNATPQQVAIEHGEHLAVAVEAYMRARLAIEELEYEGDEVSQGDREAIDSLWRGLRSAVYEFRKRAARCPAPQSEVQK